MIKVCFVCLGNICRSPMAEAVLRHIVKKEGLEEYILVDSAGTGQWHIGNPPHQGTRNMLKKYQIDYSGIKARLFNRDDFKQFRYIFAMDRQNFKDLQQFNSAYPGHYVGKFMDFVSSDNREDVPDPYFTGNFEEVYDLVKEGCAAILAFIRSEEGS